MMINLSWFWGKTNVQGQWLPAICHMMDVGAMAHEIAKGLPKRMQHNLADACGISLEKLADVLGFLSALHDIGKISPGFQGKVEQLCNDLRQHGFLFPQSAETCHGQVCMDALPDILSNALNCPDDPAYGFSCLLAAHHGVFPKEEGLSVGQELWQAARVETVNALAKVFGVETLKDLKLPPNPVSLMLAGLVSVADWLGSREEKFPFNNGIVSNFQHYLDQRKRVANNIILDLKMAVPKFEAKAFKEMFGFDKPNGCQNATLTVVAQLTHPMLVAVESSMGSGKTEAALAAYAQIAKNADTKGLYYALPTQATGNAMLPRLEKFLSSLNVENGAELHLLHSNADLNPDYEELRIATSDGIAKDVAASSWFTARKRGLLSGFGVGTIDQALMGTLKVRHFFVRLFGLAGKVLILDEVHAYDAYMQQEIISLLGWIGQCGTSVILLSATLTKALREKLIKAFRPDAKIPDRILYPCSTGIDLSSPNVIWRPISEEKGVPIHIQTAVAPKQERYARIIDLLREKLSGGGSAACLMNTVADAQRLYRKVRDAFPDDTRILFHSRFKKSRRLQIEKEILDTWGKSNNAKRPYKGIVVATQVIEQSVDVDFDFMISDLAPADLLLQRAGRLHRHIQLDARPPKLTCRELVVLLPDYQEKIPEFGDSGLVYKKDVLMRTALWLSWSGEETSLTVNLPGNGVDWIESTYDDNGAVPSQLEEAMTEWDADHCAERQSHVFIAKVDCLESVHERPDDVTYLLELNNDFDEDKMLSTRLGFNSVTLVVDPKPAKPVSKVDVRNLISNSIDVSLKEVVEHFANVESPEAWKEIAQLRYAKSVILENNHVADYPRLTYDDEIGLELHNPHGGDTNG
jgi:CRISPR-associated endonuclease/helicase Cas3